MRTRIRFAALAAAAVLGTAGVAGAAVVADPSPAPGNSGKAVQKHASVGAEDRAAMKQERKARQAERRSDHQDMLAEKLSEKLGVPKEDVAAALEEIRAEHEKTREAARSDRVAKLRERLAEAVSSGELTQEKADEILERVEAGGHPGRGHGLAPGKDGSAAPGGARSHRGPRHKPADLDSPAEPTS